MGSHVQVRSGLRYLLGLCSQLIHCEARNLVGELSLEARKNGCKGTESGVKGQKPKGNLIYMGRDWEKARSIKKHCLYGPVGVRLSLRNRFKIIISHLVF